MDGIRNYEGQKFDKGLVTKVIDPLTIEHALQISINKKSFTVVMQTPGNEKELAIGLLYAEDVIGASIANLKFDSSLDKNGLIEKINITVPTNEIGDGYKSARSLLSVSSCGICGKQSLEDLHTPKGKLAPNQTKTTWNLDTLFALQKKMETQQFNYKQTGGCHSAAIFNINGTLLTIHEDIGRHNAMDKAIGDLLSKNQLREAKIVTFSGRISYEIVSKAFRAKIPIIMAVSAPSSLAIDFAKEYGITLLAFSRNNKTTCYSNCSILNS